MDGADTAGGREVITFRVGTQEFCADVTSVREIRGWTPAMPFPQAAAHVRGVINLRGEVLAIMDLSARLGLGDADPTARHVIMVAEIGKSSLGLLVDEVSDILTITDDMVQPPPDVADETVQALVKGVISLEERMISLLRLDDLAPRRMADAA